MKDRKKIFTDYYKMLENVSTAALTIFGYTQNYVIVIYFKCVKN